MRQDYPILEFDATKQAVIESVCCGDNADTIRELGMEAAAFFAVAQFRDVELAQVLYAGDDVSGEQWDTRNWHRQSSIREKLFWVAVEAVLAM